MHAVDPGVDSRPGPQGPEQLADDTPVVFPNLGGWVRGGGGGGTHNANQVNGEQSKIRQGVRGGASRAATTLGTCLPEGQFVQSSALVPPRLNRPRGHSTPVSLIPAAPQKNPGAATHSPEQLAVQEPDTFANTPAGHAVHAVAPLELLKRPTGQGTHAA